MMRPRCTIEALNYTSVWQFGAVFYLDTGNRHLTIVAMYHKLAQGLQCVEGTCLIVSHDIDTRRIDNHVIGSLTQLNLLHGCNLMAKANVERHPILCDRKKIYHIAINNSYSL